LAIIRRRLIYSSGSRDRFVAVLCNAGVSSPKGLVRDCRGAVAAEFLIIVGPLLLLLLGTFDVGLAMLTETRINFAVEAAARCGAISAAACPSPPETAAYGASIAGLRGFDASRFEVTPAECGIHVTASYPYSGIVLPALTLSAGACYPVADATRSGA
jgi:hypothetical protein